MKLILLYFLIILMLILIMIMLSILISKKSMSNLNKSSPFECGFNPLSNKRLPFSIHFFMIAIIFLIFDVEIIIILPSILTMKLSMMKYWSISSLTFITMLIMGLYYEWFNGLLNWQI